MKVFVVWEGEYEDAWPTLFTTRELAEQYVEPRIRSSYERQRQTEWRKVVKGVVQPGPTETAGWDAYLAKGLTYEVSEMDVLDELPPGGIHDPYAFRELMARIR